MSNLPMLPKPAKHIAVVILAMMFVPHAHAQVSGYFSSSYGYNGNPLSNYEEISDQLAQSYLELTYISDAPRSNFKAGYVGGLMLFNRFAERNYYEHTLTATFTARFAMRKPVDRQSTEEEEESDRDTPFVGNLLEFGAKAGARHDRSVYKEFDNAGLEATASYTMATGETSSLRLSNQFAYRRYAFLDDLSNLTDLVEVRYGRMPGTATGVGLFASAGVKHFTSSTYDTTLYQLITPGSSSGNGKGKGNGGSAPGQVKKWSLVNATDQNSYQLTAGVTAGGRMGGCLVDGQFLYRYNPSNGSRYLAQYVNSTILTEDIYNDFFSYEGPEAQVSIQRHVPFGLKVNLLLHASLRKYSAPAFDLDAVESAPNRKDIRSLAEVTIAKTLPLSEVIDLELTLLTGFTRNQSNDAYNDYSAAAVSLGLGIGF
jgi:hypothetical protein